MPRLADVRCGDAVAGAVVIVADDFGISRRRSIGIIKAMREGSVCCTSVMANAPDADFALALARETGFLGAVGLHLNLTEGSPVCRSGEVRSLLLPPGETQAGTGLRAPEASEDGSGGLFLGKRRLREACRAGLVDPAEAAREVAAQLAWFRKAVGRAPRHVDGHQHCHVIDVLAEGIAGEIARAGATFVRVPEEHPSVDAGPSALCPVCSVVSREARRARAVFERVGLLSTRGFAGLRFCGRSYTPREFADAVTDQLPAGPGATLEVMVHPGMPCGEGEGEGRVWDEFDRAPDRGRELATLCDPGLAAVLQRAGIRLCRF